MRYFAVKNNELPNELKLTSPGNPENTIKIIEFLEKYYRAEFVQAFPNLGYSIMRERNPEIREAFDKLIKTAQGL